MHGGAIFFAPPGFAACEMRNFMELFITETTLVRAVPCTKAQAA
jgi:hypothetical protein